MADDEDRARPATGGEPPRLPLPPPPLPHLPPPPGAAWGPPSPSPSPVVAQPDLLARLASTGWARRVRISASVVGVAAALVLVGSWVGVAPPGGAPVLFVGLPLVLLGQLHVIAVARRRAADRGGSRRIRRADLLGVFAGLPRWQRVALGAVVVGSWAAAMGVLGGSDPPETTPDRCEAIYRSGGEERCVDADELERHEVRTGGVAGAVLLVFSAIHLAGAQATVRRGDEAAGAPAAVGTPSR